MDKLCDTRPGAFQKCEVLFACGSLKQKPAFEICVLAGGLSSRMGRDKSRLRLGRRTMLGHLRALAKNVKLPLRVIRHDMVPRCGPLSGIYTALKTTRADAVIFLACDMPFVSPELLAKIVKRSLKSTALFTQTDSAGFPCVIRREMLPLIEEQLAANIFSLHALAKKLHAKMFHPTRAESEFLINLNTLEDFQKNQAIYARLKQKSISKTVSGSPL